MDDMNGKVGYEDIDGVVGKWDIPGVKENGEHLDDVCSGKGLLLANSFFEHDDT